MPEISAAERYRANEPAVIHQTIDGELVIIHLDHGLYYSLDASGARIWAALVAGETPATVIDAIARDMSAERAEVAAAVDDLVGRLRAEELLVAAAPDAAGPSVASLAGSANVTQAPDGGGGTQAGSFAPPVMERYDDLQDLLLLDPIHAVDESGWPERRDGG